MSCKPKHFSFLGYTFYILLIITIVRVTAITSDGLSKDTATQTQSVVITENSDGIYKLEEKLSADELYQKALRILRTLKPLPKKRFEFDEADPSLLLLSYRLLAKFVFSIFGLRSPVTDSSEIGKQAISEYKHPNLINAVGFLEKAAFEYNHDGALFTLGELNFHAKYTHPRNLTAALHYYRELANRSGNATAQQMVGFIYATGIGNVVQDQGKALLYYTFAALGRDTAAEMTLGYRHLMGIGVPRNCEDSVFYYKRAADKAIDYYKSGPPGGRQLPPPPFKSRLYDEDGGVYGYGASGRPGHAKHGDQSVLDDILEFYHYSAENGDIPAQIGLGQLYYQGTRNIHQNFQRAYKYLKNVANKYWTSENPFEDLPNLTLKQKVAAGQAAGTLGRMYLRGEGVEQDNKAAMKWFIRGVRLDDPAAWNGLGIMHMEGIEVERNYDQAMRLFKLAADKEYSEAQVNLGLIYLYQKRDAQSALEFFRLAAEQNHILAHYYLAKMYNEGLGTERSCAVAAAYYKMVSERGDWLHSPFKAAHKTYHTGDRDGALINYLLAAERGYELGQANTAWLLDQDKSRWHPPHLIPKSDPFRNKLALIYWTRSANQGNVDSRVKMGDYYFKGFGTEVNYEKAAACYRVAADSEFSAMAMWNLGWMHENGIGVAKDFHLAKRWYDQSLSTNPDAYLPVTLSLIKLYAKSLWNYITGNKNPGDDSDESSKRLWYFFGAEGEETDEQVVTKDGNDRKEWDAVGPDGEQLIKNYNARKKGKGADEYSESSDEDGEYDDEYGNDDLMENLMILLMCFLVGLLVYLRQLRWNQGENNHGVGGGVGGIGGGVVGEGGRVVVGGGGGGGGGSGNGGGGGDGNGADQANMRFG